MTTFQTNPFFPMPTGELSLELLDNNSAPTSSIEAAQNFTLRVSWNFNTNIPGWLIPVEIKAYADELGGAFDGQIGPPPVVSLPNLPSSGSADLVVPGGTLPDPLNWLIISHSVKSIVPISISKPSSSGVKLTRTSPKRISPAKGWLRP